MKKIYFKILALIALLLFLSIEPVFESDARPGGGRSFSSSSRSSSSSSSSRSSSSSSSRSSSSYSGGSSSSGSSSSYSGGGSSGSSSSYSGGGSSSGSSSDYSSSTDYSSSSDEYSGEFIGSVFFMIIGLIGSFIGFVGWQEEKKTGGKKGGLALFFIGGGVFLGGILPYIAGEDGVSTMFFMITGFVYYQTFIKKNEENNGNQQVQSVPTSQSKANLLAQVEGKLEAIKGRDENFSKVLFLDFASLLYHKYQTYKGSAELNKIKPFLSEKEFGKAQEGTQKRKTYEIVIGSIQLIDIIDAPDIDGIAVDIEANYTHEYENGQKNRFVVNERWLFNRKKGVLSLEPQKLQDVSCPSCGAAADFSDSGTCNYCQTHIQTGEMQWFVQKITVSFKEQFSTEGLGHYEEEVGTDFPTVVQKNIEKHKYSLSQKYGQTDWNTYFESFKQNVVSPTFQELYKAWADLKWEKIRHLLTDRLYDANDFWVKTYQQQGLVPHLDNLKVTNVELARIDSDKFYDAITVRIFANCMDYVTDLNGKHIGGDRKKPRFYTEYWTFIRSTQAQKPTDQLDLHHCPNCGAAADKMGQNAQCGYCGTKVSTGDFGWVLAIITQDEVYEG